VAVESADPGSLLNLYRRLIHLRRSDAALATGTLVPLDAGNPRVVAYLRRTGSSVVLVVVNLSTAPADFALSSAGPVLPPGRYVARGLLARWAVVSLRVAADGRVAEYRPVATLGPLASAVLALTRR